MTEDRRQPLGGITKETFVNAQDESLYRGLQYDIMACIDSKIQFNSAQITKINMKCPNDCIVEFDKRYIKRAWEKLPVSKSELVTYLVVAGVLLGLGLIEFTGIVKWLPK